MTAVDFIPFVLILLAFYLLIIRPARNRQRATMALQEQLAPGVEVMMTSGIYGTIVAVQDTTVDLEIAPGTTVRFAKPAVGQVRSPESGAHDDLGVTDPDAADTTDPVGDTDTDQRDDRRTP